MGDVARVTAEDVHWLLSVAEAMEAGGATATIGPDRCRRVVARIADAERERGEADDALAACRAEANGRIGVLEAALRGLATVKREAAIYHILLGVEGQEDDCWLVRRIAEDMHKVRALLSTPETEA